jgi:Tol biopolymer transport system component
MKRIVRFLKWGVPVVGISILLVSCFPGGQRQQTFITNPVYHPTRDQIAFVSNADGDPEIYLVDIDGSNQQKLTDNSSTDINPVWSPDGDSLVFVSDRNGKYELFIMNDDGSGQKKIPVTMPQTSPQQRQR